MSGVMKSEKIFDPPRLKLIEADKVDSSGLSMAMLCYIVGRYLRDMRSR